MSGNSTTTTDGSSEGGGAVGGNNSTGSSSTATFSLTAGSNGPLSPPPPATHLPPTTLKTEYIYSPQTTAIGSSMGLGTPMTPSSMANPLLHFAGPLETDPIIAAAVTAKDKERRAALLTDSPEMSTRPPPPPDGPANSTSSTLSRKLMRVGSSSGFYDKQGSDVSVNSSTGFPKERTTVQVDDEGQSVNCCSSSCPVQSRSFNSPLKLLASRSLWKCICLGQLISLLLSAMAVLCQILVENYNCRIPTGQSFPTYLLLFLVYFPLFYWRRSPDKEENRGGGRSYSGGRTGQQPLSKVFKKRGLRYFFLAAVDVESNYLTHRALQYTTLTSVELLDCFSIPVILLVSCTVLGARYRLTHIGGMAMALASVVLLLWMDVDDGKGGVSGGGKNRLVGDMLSLGGSFLNGVSHVGFEHSLTPVYNSYEFLGFVGLFGTLISTAQICLLERENTLSIIKFEVDAMELVFLFAFTIAQFNFYASLPHILKLSSAAGLHLSLLATDIYVILAGVLLFNCKFRELQLLSLVLVLCGSLWFHIIPVQK